MERLISPPEYTPEILAAITRIKYRMLNTLIPYKSDDIKVFEHEGVIYILANPILGEEPIFNEFGQIEKMVPMHNITLIYSQQQTMLEPGWSDSGRLIVDNKIQYTFKLRLPRLRILRPDLCERIGV